MASPAIKALRVLFAALVVAWSVGAGNCWSAIIRGTITHNGSPVGHALEVQLWQLNPDTLIYDQVDQTTYNPATLEYEFINLSDGSYHVGVLDLTGVYAAEIYQDVYSEADATVVKVEGGVTQINPVDIAVELGATISGRVLEPNGTPIPGIVVGIPEMTDAETMQLAGGVGGISTDTNGEFKVGLRPGVYTVVFWDYSTNPHWATQLFSNTVAHEWATPIILTSVGQVVTNVNATMQPGYEISGTVTDTNGVKLAEVFASFAVYDPQRLEWGTSVSKRTDSNGFYSVNFPPGEYRVYFEENSRLYEREHWSDAEEPDQATPINVVNANVGNINAQLAHTPLARWAFSYGLDPFSNVEGWLKDDPDADTYDNFHEFAFGTDPTNASSGNPIQIGPVVSNTVTFSARLHQNLSTAYWLEYELCQTASVIAWPACVGVGPATNLSASDPVDYENASITVPLGVGQVLQQYFRLKATLDP